MKPVPRSWPESTVAILATGPSLTRDAIDQVRAAGARVIAIKDAIRLCPDADALYSSDAKWWAYHGPSLTFAGPRYTLPGRVIGPPVSTFATELANTGMVGLELDPNGLRTGKNSGYAAINLAVHFGARRILLLGFDMHADAGRHHYFGGHPYRTTDPPYLEILKSFPTIVEPLRKLGVEVLNVTPGSSLHVFPRRSLVEALEVAA